MARGASCQDAPSGVQIVRSLAVARLAPAASKVVRSRILQSRGRFHESAYVVRRKHMQSVVLRPLCYSPKLCCALVSFVRAA